MKKLGRKTLTVQLSEPLEVLPKALDDWDLQLNADGHEIEYVFDTKAERTGISALLGRMSDLGIGYKDLKTEERSLEDIFVTLVHAPGGAQRSEERRVGKEWVRKGSSRWSAYNSKKNKK